jgi:hypothetical protein
MNSLGISLCSDIILTIASQIDFIEDNYFSAEHYIFRFFSIAAFITRGDFGVGVNILEADRKE